MRSTLLLIMFCLPAWSATDWPSGQRSTPPVIRSVTPQAVARGATVEIIIEGLNLAGTSKVYFSQPGITARILSTKELPDQDEVRFGSNGGVSTVDLGPAPPRNQVTLELDVDPEAKVGAVDLRLLTPLGTTTPARFLVEPYYGESPDREPNDTAEQAFETFLPTVLAGAISKPGDVDFFKITAHAGEEVVFQNSSRLLGSQLDLLLTILDGDQKQLAQFRSEGNRMEDAFAYQFKTAGTYYLRVSDAQEAGGLSRFYRIKAGKIPVVISHYPLGLQKGGEAKIALKGYNLGPAAALVVKGEPTWEDPWSIQLRPKVGAGEAYNNVKLALGRDAETSAAQSGHVLSAPVTVNGILKAAHQDFRLKAKKGEVFIVDVMAARLGSPLDSLLEVLDTAEKPIERATVRALLETAVSLRDHDSVEANVRLNQNAQIGVGDYVMLGGEIVRISAEPRGPDDDYRVTNFGGERLTYLDTSPEVHAADQPVYKVQIAAPGAKFPSNGLPVVHLTYRNDDGGPGYGKDSRLHFTAPSDGEYIVRLSDVRGQRGEEYAYRLSARHPVPDYQLSVAPRNPNVPAGGRIPITVTALRLDDFDGPIAVKLEQLPAGLHASAGVIEPGQNSTTLVLEADQNVQLDAAIPLVVSDGHGHVANPEDRLKLIAVVPKSDIQVTSITKQVVLKPGQRTEVKVAVRRDNRFGGRVPVEVRNLPPDVRVIDVGLNGVLINEDEVERSFVLEALPFAKPVEQPLVLVGAIETRAGGQQNSFAAEPIHLTIQQ